MTLFTFNHSAPSSAPVNVMAFYHLYWFSSCWDNPTLENQNGVIRNHSIIIRELNTGNSIRLVSQTTAQIFYSLHPYYNYSIRVATVTVTVGPYSPEIFVTTLPDGKVIACSFITIA